MIAPGWATFFTKVKLLAALLQQAATDFTVNEPPTKFEAKDTSTLVVPCPDTMVELAGVVHKYEAAPATAAIVYVAVVGCPI